MKKTRVFQVCLLFGLFILVLSGCSKGIREIPAGYIGKILTPTGWKTGFLEAGQVALGRKSYGTYNTLVLCEATSIMIKEQFLGADGSKDGEDHRILTKNMTPLSIDFYIRAMLPENEAERNRVFALVTPTPFGGDDRVRMVKLEDVYDKFARQDVRGKARAILANYEDYKAVYSDYQKVSDTISSMVIETFEENNVPLSVLAAQLSNVKPDRQIWEALNKEIAATAEVSRINAIGEALRKNPEYVEYQKWQNIKDIGESAAKNGNPTVVIGDVGASGISASLLAGKR